jgi:hypothetical protein
MKSHRTTQVDMIITSMHAPSLHPAQAGAEGIYARALSKPSTLSEGKTRAAATRARARAEIDPRRPSILAIAFRRRRGQNRRRQPTAGVRTATSAIFCFARDFLFPREMSDPNVRRTSCPN